MRKPVQRRQPVRLRRRAAWLQTASGLPLVFASATLAMAQAQAAPVQRFDVFTVKSNDSGSGSMSWNWRDNSFQATNVTLTMLLQDAYDIRTALLVNVPRWGESKHWDIQARVSEYNPQLAKHETPEQHRAREQELLANAFHLRAHTAVKVLPVYELVVAKDGIKMLENTVKDTDPDAMKKTGSMTMNDGKLDALGITIDSLVHSLQGTVERNIVDRTGLRGKYDFKLRWTPDRAGVSADDDAASSVFAAVQEQLGLKLVLAKGPVDTLVVDSVDLPVEN